MVLTWDKWIRENGSLPKCCKLCIGYKDGVCSIHGQVPKEYSEVITECGDFEFFDSIPF